MPESKTPPLGTAAPTKPWPARWLPLYLIPGGFIISIAILAGLSLYTLSASDRLAQSFQAGEVNFRAIATAATEASSYVKRAEGHLLMYLALNARSTRSNSPSA